MSPKRAVTWLENQGWGGLGRLGFGGIGSHTFVGEDHTLEADLRLSDSALGIVFISCIQL